MPVLTRVITGEKSEYLFRTMHAAGAVYVEMVKRGGDDRDADPYCEFDGKGRTAVIRLAESHDQLWQLFLRCLALAKFDPHGRFLGFVDLDEASDDDELETAWGELAELFEAVAELEGVE